MANNQLNDEIGDKITDGWTNEKKIVLLSEEGNQDDIRQSVLLK